MFESSERKEIYGEIKGRTKLVLLEIIKGQDNKQEIDKIDDYLFTFSKPKKYIGKSGAEVVYVKNYEEMSLILTKYAQKDAKKMTVLEYYQAYQALKKEKRPK